MTHLKIFPQHFAIETKQIGNDHIKKKLNLTEKNSPNKLFTLFLEIPNFDILNQGGRVSNVQFFTHHEMSYSFMFLHISS